MRTIIISGQRHPGWLAFALAVLLPAAATAGVQHQYTISVDADLQQLSVEAQFAGAVRDISARSGAARNFLVAAQACGPGKNIKATSRRLRLPAAGIDCLSYTVDLRRAAGADRMHRYLDPANVVVSPTLWMWQPRLGDDDEIHVQFRLPENVSVSVPWQEASVDGDEFRLTVSPQSGSALAVFGTFGQRTVDVGGVELDVVLLRTPTEIDMAEIAAWVQSTANNITLTYGRFPNPAARVVVIPVGGNPWGGESPVPFGRVVRDGGETIELLVNERRPVSEYYAEWTPTHEFSHLLLPYLKRSQRWISEGFASYYQNVLLARAGEYTEQMAWQKLVAGLERGRGSVPTLSPNEAAAGAERNTLMKVYWSGASLALMADVELRRRSGGRESLDTVLGQLQQCCLPSNRAWSGIELFEKLDSLLEEPLFVRLYRRYANAAGFPDARPLLVQLGVVDRYGDIDLDDDAQLADIRRAIVAPR